MIAGKGERAKQSWTPALGNSAAAPIWESASNLSTSAAENSWYVEDGDYIRIQNISLGYNIPKAYTSKLGIKRVKFTLSANNIFTLTKYKGLDPEIGGGIDNNSYPRPRMYSLNFTFNF